ncbi:MAG: DUF5050 domain-containing protein, partial [Lachnospiraceae bacterium]|nr:DUF5050 domain-containing protein [Candidatus Merdinaster equi]
EINMKLKVIIPIVIVALLIAGIVVLRALNQDVVEDYPEGTIGNIAGNINNGGYFCESEGKVYFSNSYDDGAMYVMNSDETELKKIVQQSVKYINVAGKHIFYYQADNTSGSDLGSVIKASGLYRCTTNGEFITGLKRGVIANMLLSGGHLYYQFYDKKLGLGTYKMNLNGEEDEQIEKYAWNPACGLDRYIYFNGIDKDHDLYRLDTRNDEIARAFTGNMWSPVYSAGYIYYQDLSDNYRIYRLNINSGEVNLVADYRTEAFNVSDNYVYFTVSAKNGDPRIMRITKEGTNEVVLLNGNYSNLSVTSSYVYFNVYETGELYHCSHYSDRPAPFDAAKEAAIH